jgi:hypothetical protein
MQSIYRSLAVAVLAAALPLTAAAQEAPTDTVRLRFGWAPGMRADVEYEHVRVRNVEGERDSTRMASVYRLEVDPHPEGLTVRYADMRWTELPRMEGPAGQFFDAIGRTSSGGKPRIVVSRAGQFVRAEGMEQVAAELRQAAEPMMAEMQGEGLQAFRDMMETTFSEEGAAAAVANEWSALVGAWADWEMEVRAVYEAEDSMPVPLLPGVMMPVTALIQPLGRVACTDPGEDGGCVEIFTTSVPDPDALRQAVGEFLREAGVPDEGMDEVLGQLRLQTYVTLVTEPGTLRPWLLETTRTVSGGENQPPVQEETETYRFRWRQ